MGAIWSARLSRRRFGGGSSSFATQSVFDSAGLRQIRALDSNRARRRAAATVPMRRSEVAGNEQNAAGNFSSRRR
jgi:hypothetical protein